MVHTENESSDGFVGENDSSDSRRVNRRAAMRAAAGGAVAAGVFVAPRVEGLSLVPNYASAASGDDATVDQLFNTTNQQANTAPLCLQRCCITCWNSTGLVTNCARTTCNCGTNKSCGTAGADAVNGVLTVNKNSPAGSSINLNYSLWGPTEGCTGGTPQSPSLNLVLAGIDPPYQSCDVSVTGSCATGTFVGGGTVTGVTTNGTVSISPLAPGCSGSLSGPGSATAFCAAPASLTVTLSCTFL